MKRFFKYYFNKIIYLYIHCLFICSTKDSGRIRGEFTILFGPDNLSFNDRSNSNDDIDIINDSLIKLRSDGVSRSEAVKLVIEMTGYAKSKVYKRALDYEWPSTLS